MGFNTDKYDQMIYESCQRFKWWIYGTDIHCLSWEIFQKIPTSHLSRMFNIDPKYFRYELQKRHTL